MVSLQEVLRIGEMAAVLGEEVDESRGWVRRHVLEGEVVDLHEVPPNTMREVTGDISLSIQMLLKLKPKSSAVSGWPSDQRSPLRR